MKRIATIIIGLALLLPSTALANSSTCQAYSAQACTVASTVASTTAAQGTTATASTLPFTGLDVVLLAAGGGTLLGAGLVVRRLSGSAGD